MAPAKSNASESDGSVAASGDKKLVGGSTVVAEGVTVGPAGLAIPVVGVKAEGPRRHLYPGAGRGRAGP